MAPLSPFLTPALTARQMIETHYRQRRPPPKVSLLLLFLLVEGEGERGKEGGLVLSSIISFVAAISIQNSLPPWE